MEELIIRIREKTEKLLHAKVSGIEKIENVPNNSVYKILVDNKPYIFKIYNQITWPEDGKLIFINRKLIENHVGCAKIIAFDRNDSFFHTGYVLEECLPGITADRINFDSETGKEFYKKLALLVSKIHQIPIENYGYIGSGIASYSSFVECMNDKYDEIAEDLITKKCFKRNSLLEMKTKVMNRLRLCDHFPSVLNHGDLSTKNVMMDKHGGLTLIDWDDAMSYNWIADLSRMTYWMKFHYNDDDYAMYRNTFMEHYSTDCLKSDFDAFENTFHVWIGLDHLNYYANTPEYEQTLMYFNQTVAKLT